LASGNHVLEAISHAICEVVERDAATMWGLLDEQALGATRVDIGTVDDPLCREALEKYERADIAVTVCEITSDVGIPAFDCQIVDRSADPLRSLFAARGTGCHPSRAIALLRALTEAAQSRLTVIAGSRDDVVRVDYERSGSAAV